MASSSSALCPSATATSTVVGTSGGSGLGERNRRVLSYHLLLDLDCLERDRIFVVPERDNVECIGIVDAAQLHSREGTVENGSC